MYNCLHYQTLAAGFLCAGLDPCSPFVASTRPHYWSFTITAVCRWLVLIVAGSLTRLFRAEVTLYFTEPTVHQKGRGREGTYRVGTLCNYISTTMHSHLPSVSVKYSVAEATDSTVEMVGRSDIGEGWDPRTSRRGHR